MSEQDPFGFLGGDGDGGFEASIVAKVSPVRPLVFKLEPTQDAKTIADGLRALNKDVIVQEIDSSALSVIIPPQFMVGDDPVDLKTVAFLLQYYGQSWSEMEP
jgi:hypothetical protein